MILGKIRIQNFKSIIDSGDIYLSKADLITILAGQNESGKTAFLRALRFFEEGPYDGFEEEDRRMETSPRVQCTFYLTKEEYEQLQENANKKIADYFQKNGFTIVRGKTEEDNFESLKYINPNELNELVNEYNESLAVEESDENETEENSDEVEEFNPYSYFDKIRPRFVFYSSFTNSILPGKIIYGEIDSNRAVQDFETVYGVKFKYLLSASTQDAEREREQERIRKKATDSLNTYWNQTISGEEVEYKFAISIRNNNTDVNQGYVNFFINQGDEPQLSISQKSQGFQWFSGFNLRLRAHQKELDEQGIILLIDEPGQGLHEQAQNDVKCVLEELAEESNIQIIYSTHQPILLGKEDVQFSRLLLADRNKTDGSKFKTISQLITSNGSRDALAPIRSALGLISIQRIPGNQKTLVTEGVTEYFYLRALFQDDFTIIPSAGVDQVPNIFAILYGWGVNAKVLVDDDRNGKKAFNKIKKEFFNNKSSGGFSKTVLKIDGCDGIENLLSERSITNILSLFDKKYDNQKSKIDNVRRIGKMIFAKSFFDQFSNGNNGLDTETRNNFQQIKDFIDN